MSRIYENCEEAINEIERDIMEMGLSYSITLKSNRGKQRRFIRINGKRMKFSHYVYCKYYGLDEIPNGHIIHHIDYNQLNDDIRNLKLMTQSDHLSIHAKTNDHSKRLKFDVYKVHEEYINSNLSMRQLAKKYKTSHRTIGNNFRKENLRLK